MKFEVPFLGKLALLNHKTIDPFSFERFRFDV